MAGFYTCGPNEALVVSGCCHAKPKMVVGGRLLVFPCVQKIGRLPLNVITTKITTKQVYTQLGVPINVTGTAQIKIHSKEKKSLMSAAELFMNRSAAQINKICSETLEGHQRAIMGTMTVEEIYKDRSAFSEQVLQVASTDLMSMGIRVISYTINEVTDDEGYLKALGKPRTAEVKRDADIGNAEAKRDAGIEEARANMRAMEAVYSNKITTAQAQRDYLLKKAIYDQETFTKKASSDLAYELQSAKTQQRIKEETMQIKVVERQKQIAIQEQEITRKQRELDAQVIKPAEAERYKIEKLAEAERNKRVIEAEAKAEAIRLKAEAQAYAIEAKAKAEAEQMAKKADAWNEYKDAAMVDMILQQLPKIAAEVAAPLQNVNKITLVAGPNGEIGAAKLTGEVLEIVRKLPKVIEEITGVDMSKAMKIATAN